MLKRILIASLFFFACSYAFSQAAHTESFDGTTFPPNGWIVNGTYSSTTYLNRLTASTLETVSSGHTGVGFCRFRSQIVSGTNSGNLFTPKIDYTNRGASTPTISVWVYRDVNATYNTATYDAEGAGVYVNTSASLTSATLLGFIPRRGGLAASGTYLTTATNLTVAAAGWYQYSFDIPAAFTSCAYIGFKFVPKAGRNTYIDDIDYTSYPALPGCAVISSPANGGTGLSPVNPALTLNWSAPVACSEISGYKLYLGTDAGATNMINGTNIGLVTSYTPTLVANTTYYWKIVPTNGAGDASGCTIWSFSTGASNPSCTGQACCGGGTDGLGNPVDWITDVYMGAISRYVAGYESYANTGQSTNVVIGTGYNLNMYTTGNQGTYINVYIDWNQDGDFQDLTPNETVATLWTGYNVSTTITPPAGALSGSTVMRIMEWDDDEGWAPSPAGCGDMNYGEVEDYKLNVCATQITAQPAATYTTCATIGSQTFTATTSGATSHQWQYSANGSTGWGNVVNNTPAGATYVGATTPTLTVSGITTGALSYYYRLNAIGGCTATSTTARLDVRTISTDMTSLTAPQYTICPGNSTTLTAVGGVRGYNNAPWKWYTGSCGGTLLASTTTNTLAVTPAVTTTYFVRFEGTCNNTNCVSTTITVGGAPTTNPITTTGTSPICNGGSTTLTVTNPTTLGAGSAWVWYTGSCGGTYAGTGNPLVISPGVTTTYYVRAEGCNITTCVSRAVTVNNIPACNTLLLPSNGATNQCRNVTLTWNSIAGATGYKLYLGTDAAATNIINGTNLGVVYSYVVPTLTASTLHYWKIVPTNTCGDASGGGCTIRTFTTGTVPCYCGANASSVGGLDLGGFATDWITDVYMGSISRYYAPAESYVYTGQSTNVVIGTGYNLNMYTTGNQGTYINVYIDWNQDGDFQDLAPNETVANLWTGYNVSTTITPPAGALSGSTIMRIMEWDDDEGWAPAPAGCGDMNFGEVEDYIVTVCPTQVTVQPAATYTTCATIGSQTLTATTSGATSHQWQYSANGSTGWGNVVNNTPAGATYVGATTPTLTVSGITTGGLSYYYRLNATSAACTATSTTARLDVRTISTDPTSLTAPQYTVCPGNSTTLTINGGSKGYLANWKWYTGSCGGTLLTTTSSNTLAVTPGATTTYFARAEGTCNNTLCVSTTITVGGTPSTAPVSTTATSPICNGGSSTLTVTNPTTLGAGASWEWYTGSCGGTYVGSGSPLVVSPGVTTTYYVRAEGCNITTCVSRAVTVNNIPACNALTLPSNGATGQCRNVTLTWSTIAGATGYKLYLGTDAAATNIVNGTNLGAVTSYVVPTLAASTLHYWKIVPTNTCGDASGCTIRTFTTGTIPCYCPAYASSGGGTDGLGNPTDWITDVYMGSISRYYAFAESYVNTGQSTIVMIGTGYNLNMYTTGNQGTYINVYVDWNQDGDFQEANETVANLWTGWNVSTTITPPAGALPGNAVMRIMEWDDDEGWAPSPAGCGDMNFGEVEDYILVVCPTQITVQPANNSACITSGSAALSVTAVSASSYQWQYKNGAVWNNVVNGTPAGAVYSNATSATMTVAGISSLGTYQYRSNAIGGACTITSSVCTLTVINTVPSLATYTFPGNGSINQCPSFYTSLNWTASTGSPAGYKLYFGTDAAATNIVNGTNIGNVLTYNPLPLSNNTTYYWKIVPTNNCSDATGAVIWSFTTGSTCYCVPNYTSNGCGLSMYISNFTTTGGATNINNSTGCSPSTASYYADYSSLTVSVVSGNAFSFSVTQPSVTYNMGFRIWIDYNNDFDFADAGEDVWNSVTIGKTFSGSIVVPAGTTPGIKRIRVRNKYNAVPLITDYCTTLTYGETEDYGLIVVAPCTAPTVQASSITFSGVTCNQMNVNWTNGNGSKRILVAKSGSAVAGLPSNSSTYSANTVFGTGGFIAAGEYVVYNGTSNSVTVTGLTQGTTYHYKVFEFNCTPGWEEYLFTSPPSNNQVTVSASTPIAGPVQYVCSPTSVVTMAASGAGTWSQISGPNTPNIVSPASPTTQIGTITGLVSGTYVFRWTGTCGNIYDDVRVIRQ